MRIVDVVRKVAPGARPEYLAAFAAGDALMRRYAITTPKRAKHFLAQVLHESGGLKVTFEVMNYRTFAVLKRTFGAGHHSAALSDAECRALLGKPVELAERVYGLGNAKKAKELGNTRPGDGWRCRGGGLMQTTGGYNYRKMSARCGVDFYAHPELLVSAEHALKPALSEWSDGNCNDYADRDDILAISRIINLGNARSSRTPNGMRQRKAWLAKVAPLCERIDFASAFGLAALEALDVPEGKPAVEDLPAEPAAEPADVSVDDEPPTISVEIETVQRRLKAMGYTEVGNFDGNHGSFTTAAIAAFEHDRGLPVDGRIDAVLLAAIDAAEAEGFVRPISPERAAGIPEHSRIVAGAEKQGAVGLLATVGGVVSAIISTLSGWFDSVRDMIEPIQPLLRPLTAFVAAHWPLLLLAGGGFVLWQAAKIRWARREDEATGKTR